MGCIIKEICLNALYILNNRFNLLAMVMECDACLLISLLIVPTLTGTGSLVFAQTDTTISTKTTESHPEANTTIITTITTTVTSASPTQTSKNSFMPTPIPTPAPTLTATPAPTLTATPAPTLTATPTPTPAPALAATRTVSGQKPINDNVGGNFLDIVAINANRQQTPENVAVNVLDTNQSTRWSGQGKGTWIQADLGSEKPIKSVGIAWYKGALRQYDFEISSSNITTEEKNFMEVFSGQSSGKTDSIERYDIKDVQGQYLRITIYGNTDSKASSRDWASVTTLMVYP